MSFQRQLFWRKNLRGKNHCLMHVLEKSFLFVLILFLFAMCLSRRGLRNQSVINQSTNHGVQKFLGGMKQSFYMKPESLNLELRVVNWPCRTWPNMCFLPIKLREERNEKKKKLPGKIFFPRCMLPQASILRYFTLCHHHYPVSFS